jgi:ATP-dependent helicase HrpB
VLISERDPLDPRQAGCDLLQRLDWLRASPGAGADRLAPGRNRQRRELLNLQQQLGRQVRTALAESNRTAKAGRAGAPKARPSPAEPEARTAARLVSWAFPERIALAREGHEGRFLLRSGQGARVHGNDPLAGAAALAIALADSQGPEARVQLGVLLDPTLLEELAAQGARQEQEARWDGEAERVRCEETLRLGALVLARTPWPEAEGEAVLAAMLEGLGQMGLEALPWCPRSRTLQRRLALAHRCLGSPWPERSWPYLQLDPAAWLSEALAGMRNRQDLRRLDLAAALWGELDWEHRRQLDRWFPEQLRVPSGREIPIDYGAEEPVLAVKLQEMFGCMATPTVLEGRIPLTIQLLSPAGKPAAITKDLAGFWSSGYPEVRRELRGRYPKHPWPEDPSEALPTALTKARLKRVAAGEPGP